MSTTPSTNFKKQSKLFSTDLTASEKKKQKKPSSSSFSSSSSSSSSLIFADELRLAMLNEGQEIFVDARTCYAGSCIRDVHQSGVDKVAENIISALKNPEEAILFREL